MNKDVLRKLAKIESKVELGTVRVDLAIVDDILKASTDGQAMINVLTQDFTILKAADKAIADAQVQAEKVSVASEKNVQKASAMQTKIGTLLDKADASANALGVDPKAIKGYNELNDMYASLEKAYKEVGLYYKWQN